MCLNNKQCAGMVLAGVALITWGSIGLYHNAKFGFSGGLYTPDFTVPASSPASEAAKAGLLPGDRVVSVEGIPVEKLGMESRWPRSLSPKVGESRRFLVERKQARVLVNVTYPAAPPSALSMRYAPAIAGLAFLVLGVWTFLTMRTRAAQALAYIGLSAGATASLGVGPSLGSWNGVSRNLSTAFMVLLAALLLRFFLAFPEPKRLYHHRLATWAIYGAWGAFLVFLAMELAVHPALYDATGSVAFPLFLAYGILALVGVGHTLATAPRELLRESGMYLITGGIVATILVIVVAVVSTLNLPGWAYGLAIVPIPLAMAMAVRKQASFAGRAKLPSPATSDRKTLCAGERFCGW